MSDDSSAGASGLAALRGASPRDAATMVWRKFVHRRVEMGRYGVPTAESDGPVEPCELTLEVWGPDRFDEIVGTNPHLDADDVRDFRAQRSQVIVVLDGDRVAASSWMTGGRVFVHELQRHLEVPEGEHFSCRTYVDPDYRGLSLMRHMIHTYSQRQPTGDEVWGLVYDWNVASVHSLERIGWRRSGDYWTTWWFGRQQGGERRYPARPATTI